MPTTGFVTVQSSSHHQFQSVSTFHSSSSTTYSSTSASITSVGLAFGSVSDAKTAFRRFDINGDGVIDKEEMKQLMSAATGKATSTDEIDMIFKKADLDGDGQIDMHEFIKFMFPSSADALTKLQRSFGSLNDIKAGFIKCDVDGDGHISKEELRSMMKNFSGTEVDAIFALGDKDQSGGINFSEFLAMMIPNSGSILKKIASNFSSEQQVIDGFKKIDANGDGAISKAEMKNGLKLSEQELEVVFALGDLDQDGEISLSEFVKLMCPAAESGLSRFRNSFRNIQEVVSAFKRFDANGDGSLSQQELINGMRSTGAKLTAAEMKAIFVLADINQDGQQARKLPNPDTGR